MYKYEVTVEEWRGARAGYETLTEADAGARTVVLEHNVTAYVVDANREVTLYGYLRGRDGDGEATQVDASGAFVSDYRAIFIEVQVSRGIDRKGAERAAEHMIAGRIVPDIIDDAAARGLAWKMVRESRWPIASAAAGEG